MSIVESSHIQTIPADRESVLSEYRAIIRRRLARPGDLQRLADLATLLAKSDEQVTADARLDGMDLHPFYARRSGATPFARSNR